MTDNEIEEIRKRCGTDNYVQAYQDIQALLRELSEWKQIAELQRKAIDLYGLTMRNAWDAARDRYVFTYEELLQLTEMLEGIKDYLREENIEISRDYLFKQLNSISSLILSTIREQQPISSAEESL